MPATATCTEWFAWDGTWLVSQRFFSSFRSSCCGFITYLRVPLSADPQSSCGDSPHELWGSRKRRKNTEHMFFALRAHYFEVFWEKAPKVHLGNPRINFGVPWKGTSHSHGRTSNSHLSMFLLSSDYHGEHKPRANNFLTHLHYQFFIRDL